MKLFASLVVAIVVLDYEDCCLPLVNIAVCVYLAVNVGAIVAVIDPEMITISKKCRSSIKIWIRSDENKLEVFMILEIISINFGEY